MPILNDQSYKICLIDTCIISDFYENQKLYQNFLDLIIDNKHVVCIQFSTILELKKVPKAYNWFKKEFTKLPTYLAKPSQILLEDELKKYPYTNNEKILFVPLQNKVGEELLEYFSTSDKIETTSKLLDSDKQTILDSINNLKKNFPPNNNGKYINDKIEEFVDKVTLQQLSRFFSKWNSEQLIKSKTINPKKFKSLQSQLYITFWKFYLLKDRKHKKSDVFDITIVSILPYVDVVITEKNIKNDIDQIKKRELFFTNLEAMTINDFKIPKS